MLGQVYDLEILLELEYWGDVIGMDCKDTLIRESVGCSFIGVLALGLPGFDAVFVSGVSDVMVTC